MLCWKLKIKTPKSQTVFPRGASSVKCRAWQEFITLTLCGENLDYQREEPATTVTDYAWRSQGLLLFAQRWRARIKNSLCARDVTGYQKKWFYANEEIFLKRVIREKTTTRREWNSLDVSANFGFGLSDAASSKEEKTRSCIVTKTRLFHLKMIKDFGLYEVYLRRFQSRSETKLKTNLKRVLALIVWIHNDIPRRR